MRWSSCRVIPFAQLFPVLPNNFGLLVNGALFYQVKPTLVKNWVQGYQPVSVSDQGYFPCNMLHLKGHKNKAGVNKRRSSSVLQIISAWILTTQQAGVGHLNSPRTQPNVTAWVRIRKPPLMNFEACRRITQHLPTLNVSQSASLSVCLPIHLSVSLLRHLK